MASLSLKHIDKTYPNGFKAVKDFNLQKGARHPHGLQYLREEEAAAEKLSAEAEAAQEALNALRPDMAALAAYSIELDVVGVHAFALSDDGYTAHVRNFGPLIVK